MPTVFGRRAKRDGVKVCRELLAYIREGMVGAAEARARRVFVEDDHLSVRKCLPFAFGLALEGEVVLAERREQEISLRLEHAEAVPDPRMLEVLREVCDHR